MNERLSERIEQKFMNEILIKTREIEENSFFQHDNRLFRQFLQNTGNCYNYILKKSEKSRNIKKKSAKTAIFGQNKVFFKSTLMENRALSYFRYCHFASVCKIL